MLVEELIKFLGVKTQSLDSIHLCYMVDLEAFNIMNNYNNKGYENEKKLYDAVYKLLLNELNYSKISDEEKNQLLDFYNKNKPYEQDKDFRDLYFSGLERTLIRYGCHNLINLDFIKDDLIKRAYITELNARYDEAISLYKLNNLNERILICNIKKSQF